MGVSVMLLFPSHQVMTEAASLWMDHYNFVMSLDFSPMSLCFVSCPYDITGVVMAHVDVTDITIVVMVHVHTTDDLMIAL